MTALDPLVCLVVFLSGLLLCGGWRFGRNPNAVLHGFGKQETLPLRGVLVTLVVLGHMDSMTGREFWLLHGIHWATPAVAVFFFLSGYGLWKGIRTAEEKGETSVYWKRFSLCSPVKLLFPVVVLGVCVLLHGCLMGSPVRPKDLLRLVTGMSLHNTWYVRTLLLFYAYYFLSFTTLGRKRGFWLVLVGVACYWLVMKYGFHKRFFRWGSCYAFPAGFLFAAVENDIRSIVLRWPLRVSAALTFSLAVVLGLHAPREVFYVMLGPVVAVVLYYWNGLAKVNAFNYLGRHSYEIYLVHGIFQYGFLKLSWPPLIYIGSVLAATMVTAIPLHVADAWVMDRLRKGL